MAPAVETRALVKRYGTRRALDGVDLSVPEGTIFGFLGPNGAGKTTTMRVLLGLLRADAGHVRVLGADPWRSGPAGRADVGYLPGEPGLYGRMTGTHTLEHYARLDARPPALRAEACAALRLTGEDLGRHVRTYSRGMRQKLAIVLAVQHDPRLLVLDEPSEGLDPLVQEGFFAFLRARRDAGRTILFSSHVLSEVEVLCDRVALIRAGRIVDDGTIADLRRERPLRVTLQLADPAAAGAIPGGEVVERNGRRVVLAYRGAAPVLLRHLAALDVADVRIEDPGLEEIFLGYYGDGDGAP